MKSRAQVLLEQSRLISLHPQAAKALSANPTVIGVGVGIKETQGSLTETLCYRVYVDRKLDSAHLGKHLLVPETILGIPTDVLEKEPTILNSFPDTTKYPSLRGGVQIRNEYFSGDNSVGAGTIGCLARTVVGNKLVGLTAGHVLTDGRTGSPPPAVTTIDIGHPRWIKCCCCCTYNEVGLVSRVSSVAGLDCGIFELDTNAAAKVVEFATEDQVWGVGLIKGVEQAVCYELVRKRGAATGITFGIVVDVLYDGGKLLINPCTEYANFSQPGDSGAVIVNKNNKVVGLLVGASRTNAAQGVAHHIKPVLVELDITIAAQGASTAGLVGVPAAACTPGGITTMTTDKELSRYYFREIDDGTLFLESTRNYLTLPLLTLRKVQVFDRLVPFMLDYIDVSVNGWLAQARNNAVPTAGFTITSGAQPELHAALVALSLYQLDLFRAHFPGSTSGSIDYVKVRTAFEQFMNGELREQPSILGPPSGGGPREPDGSFELMFSTFAWLCVKNNIDAAEWTDIYRQLVQCQEIFMFVYRRHPQGPPPANSLPIPSFTPGATGNTLFPSGPASTISHASFASEGYLYAFFNVTGATGTGARISAFNSPTSPAQSDETRKAGLRIKYAGFTLFSQIETAMKENLQRMMYMGDPPF